MVDVGTFNRLSPDEQSEYQRHADKFVRAVLKSGTQDSYDFEEKYPIQNINGMWCLAKSGSTEAFAGIKSSSKAVIEALLTGAVQNYGR
ncbi:hypothetical protein Misp06_00048 [Microbulbifer sp. NBRC 101763]|uniref:hypothetical protein n=1 Tax=Microbulbifer sp. NBRC 101763 TaxID=1113820 RepID=UPI00309B72EF